MINYGQRVRAFVVPPISGNYTFWIASDDTSDLFISTDETPANEALVAYVSSWTAFEAWNSLPGQQSAQFPCKRATVTMWRPSCSRAAAATTSR